MHRFARLVYGFTLSIGMASAVSADGIPKDLLVPAPKLDNGLGSLPPASEWREPWLYAIPAEKVDSGLGSLPPVAEWKEPWLYAMPAEKIDSGLGSLPPASQWSEPWLHASPADGSPGATVVRVAAQPAGDR